jgi:hypothetical protein
MNDQRFRLYFRLGATVLALSGLTNVMVVLEHRSLAETSGQLDLQAAQLREQLPLMDQAVRELAIAGSPDPVIAGIVRQAGIVMNLPMKPAEAPAEPKSPAPAPAATTPEPNTETPPSP